MTLYDLVDVTGPITPNGAAVSVSLPTPGQNARLSFDGSQGQMVRLNLTGGTFAGCDLHVSLLNPDGTTLASNACVGTSGYISATTLPTTGTYTVLADPQGAATGNVTATLARGEVAGTIAPGGPAVPVTLSTPGQNAWLTFSGTAGQRVSLNLPTNTVTGDCCSRLVTSLLNPDGSALVAPRWMDGPGFIDTLTLPATGTYVIVLDPQNAAVGSVTASLYDVADQAGTITADGAAATITIATPGQNARLTFSGAAGQRVSLNLPRVTVTADCCSRLVVSILNPDGSTLVAPRWMDGGGFIDVLSLPAAGTYTILLDPQNAATGGVTLALYTVTDLAGSLTADGAATAVSIATPGQNARLTFSGSTGQRVSLNLPQNTVTADCCSRLMVSILKPDGSALVAPRWIDGPGFIDTIGLPADGAYTVVLDPQNAAVGNVTLRLYTVVDSTGTIAIGDPAVTVSIATPGQNSRLTFSGAAGQRVSLTLANSTITAGCCSRLLASLLNPDGSTLVAPRWIDGNGQLGPVTLPTAGTYTIVLDPQDAATGGVTLALAPASGERPTRAGGDATAPAAPPARGRSRGPRG